MASNNNNNNHEKSSRDEDAFNDNQSMVDITELVTVHGIASLTISEPFVCNASSFSLHDAMAASQLTDKKMDSCQVPAHLAAPLVHHTAETVDDSSTTADATTDKVLFPRPPPVSLDDAFLPLPWNNLNMSQASCIVLEMLVRCQALFCGASVCESTFTCLYVHAGVLADMENKVVEKVVQVVANNDNDDDPTTQMQTLTKQFEQLLSSTDDERNVDASSSSTSTSTCCLHLAQFVVFSMSYALLDITHLFRGIVMNADIYEEEDFVSMTNGIVFYENISEHAAEQHLKRALQMLKKARRRQQQQSSSSSSNGDGDGDDEDEYAIKIITLVLQTMLGLHGFMYRMAKVCGPNVVQTVTNMQQLAVTTVQHLQKLHKLLLLDSNSSKDKKSTFIPLHERPDCQAVIHQSFDSYVNRPLLGNAPVRKVHFLSPLDATRELIAITEELDWAVCRLLLHGTTLGRVERMLDRVTLPTIRGGQTQQGINILSRSLIVLNLYFDDKLLGRLDVAPLLGQYLEQWQHVPACYKESYWPSLSSSEEEENNGNHHHSSTPVVEGTVVTASSMSTEGDTTSSTEQQHSPQQPTTTVLQDPAQAFFHRLAKPVYDTLKLRTSNRNRQRTYLEAVIFRDWTALQHEASMVDVHYYHLQQQAQQQQQQPSPPQQFYNKKDPTIPLSQAQRQQPPSCFGHYVLGTLIRLMDRHLSCGVQLGLFYGHDELCSAFWYRDFLLAALAQNLNVMRQSKQDEARAQLLQQQQQQASSTATSPHSGGSGGGSGKGGKGGKKKSHKHKSNGKHGKKNASSTQATTSPSTTVITVTPEELEDECEMQVLELKRMLCRGLVRFIVALRKAGLLTMPSFAFTSLERMFCKRFQVFQSIRHPPALTFGDYLEGSNASHVSPAELVQSTVEVFTSAKAAVDRLLAEYYDEKSDKHIEPMYAPLPEEEVRHLLKVCVGNSVYLMRLQQLLRSSPEKKAKIDFDFDAHKEFCIIKLS